MNLICFFLEPDQDRTVGARRTLEHFKVGSSHLYLKILKRMTTEPTGKLQKLARSSKSLREKLTGLVILNDIQFDTTLDITPDDIMMPSMQVTNKYVTPFLGHWTPDDIWKLLDQFKIIEILKAKSLQNLVV